MTRWLGFLLSVGLIGLGASCDKGTTRNAEAATAAPEAPAPTPPAPAAAAAPAKPPAAKPPAGPEPKLPELVLRGLDLQGDDRARFFALYEQAPSPCGKAHSLHKSVDTDAACKRAPYAARFLARLIEKGAADDEAIGRYGKRYLTTGPAPSFDLKGVAHVGDPKAKVVLVEFFDYGCPHCKVFSPLVEKLATAYAKDVVVYYMNFPLGHWATSEPAARAAIAADRQGKFAAFHHALFEAQGQQDDATIRKIAKGLGLDLARFEADWHDPAIAAMVTAQHDQGLHAGIEMTPTIWMNGKQYLGIPLADWLNDAVDEELAALKQ